MTMEQDIAAIREILERKYRDSEYGLNEEQKTAVRKKVIIVDGVLVKDETK